MTTINDVIHAYASNVDVDTIMQMISDCEPITYDSKLLAQIDCALYENVFEAWLNVFDANGLFSSSLPLINLDIDNRSLSLMPDRRTDPLCVIFDELRNNANRQVDFEHFRYFPTPTVKNENEIHFCYDSVFGFLREEFANTILFRLILQRDSNGKYTLTYVDDSSVSLTIFSEV